MSKIQVYKVRLDVERKCVAEDTEVSIYLSRMRFRNYYWPKIKKVFKVIGLFVLRLLIPAFIVAPYAIYTVRMATIHRGYEAYGGEYFSIAFAYYIVFEVVSWVFRMRRSR